MTYSFKLTNRKYFSLSLPSKTQHNLQCDMSATLNNLTSDVQKWQYSTQLLVSGLTSETQ